MSIFDIADQWNILPSLVITCTLWLLDNRSQDNKNWHYYILFFFIVYSLSSSRGLYSENIISNNPPAFLNYSQECEEDCQSVLDRFEAHIEGQLAESYIKIKNYNCVCDHLNSESTLPESDYYNTSSMLNLNYFSKYTKHTKQSFPSREELLKKIIFHNKEYTKALVAAEILLKKANLWNDILEDLYHSAKIGAVSVTSGTSSLRSFVIVIVEYATSKVMQIVHIYRDWHTQMCTAEYHAEMFDFYYGMLLELYGG